MVGGIEISKNCRNGTHKKEWIWIVFVNKNARLRFDFDYLRLHLTQSRKIPPKLNFQEFQSFLQYKSKNCEIWVLEILLTFYIWMRTFTFRFRRKITLSKYWPPHFTISHYQRAQPALSCKIILKMIAAPRLSSSSRSPDTIGLFPGPKDKDS